MKFELSFAVVSGRGVPGPFEEGAELFFGSDECVVYGFRIDPAFSGDFVVGKVVDVFVEKDVELFGRRLGFDEIERRFGVIVVGFGEVVAVFEEELIDEPVVVEVGRIGKVDGTSFGS